MQPLKTSPPTRIKQHFALLKIRHKINLHRLDKNFVNSDLVTANNCILGKSKKASQLHYAIGDRLPRSLGFYFGSVIFFIGILLMALGISKVIVGTLDLSAFVELISGVVLIIIGSRAIRSVQR
jgi:uncharacterized membrane protein